MVLSSVIEDEPKVWEVRCSVLDSKPQKITQLQCFGRFGRSNFGFGAQT